MLESGIVGHALPREREQRKMRLVVLTHVLRWGRGLPPGSVLGVPNSPLMVLSDELGGPNIL